MIDGTLPTKETERVTHSLMKEHSGKTLIMMGMAIILSLHSKAMLVLPHTEPVSKTGLDALTVMETDTQTKEMYSLPIKTNGQILILTVAETITTMTFNNSLNSISTREVTHSR